MSRDSKLHEPVDQDQAAPKAEPAKVQVCPECGSTRLMRDYECAEIVCMDCGFVVAAKIADRGPEWRAFDDEQRSKRTRVGAPLTYTIHDKGLSTTIDWHDRDIYGKSLSPGQKAQVYRLRKWQRRIRVSDATERNLAFALSEITKISNNLNLPKNILETASVIYRKAVKERLIRGRSIQGVTSAALYLACRQCGLPQNLRRNRSGINREQERSWKKLPFPNQRTKLFHSTTTTKPIHNKILQPTHNAGQSGRNRPQNLSCSKRT